MGDLTFFTSFFLAGFDCSCQRRHDGRRIDLLAGTGHDRFAAADYARLAGVGIRAARDGVRWHLVERAAGRYDFSELLPRLKAARDTGVEVAWDLCHYGWPDGLDIWGAEFVERFARYARATAAVVLEASPRPPWYVPINEISFWSWIGGEMGHFNPFTHGRGFELKAQLVRAAIAATAAIREVDPRARFLCAEPLIQVTTDSPHRAVREAARGHHLAQYQAVDMLLGRLCPELGGAEDAIDVIGVNYYPDNQWILDGPKLDRGNPLHRPLADLLTEVFRRYRRPLLLAETGAEGDARAPWLRGVCDEVRRARSAGVPVAGICLYPILDYPGWDDDRHCPAGLWCHPGPSGERAVHDPLARELDHQRRLFATADSTADLSLAGAAGRGATISQGA